MSERTPYEEQMLRLFANWQIFDEEIQATKIREFRNLWAEFGEQRFTAGATAIINEGRYKLFPSVAEFRSYVPERVRKPYCGNCIEGWRFVPDYEARKMYHNDTAMAVVRCECRRTA